MACQTNDQHDNMPVEGKNENIINNEKAIAVILLPLHFQRKP